MAGDTTRLTFELFGRDNASPVFDKFGKRVRNAGDDLHFLSKATKFAGGALAGLAVVDTGLDLFRSSIDNASDLGETLNKTSVVFGRSSDTVIAWGSNAERSLGLSKQAALAAASQFGDMFKQLGQGDKQAAKTSENVVKLATDLGSFHNLETADVLDKISGAMRGEYDSIQQIIPGLSDTRVKQEALTTSGKKSVDQLTEQDKAMAALAIITKDGAAAHNDFAETSDGLANKSKILSAAWDNAKAELGEGLLPVMTDGADFLLDKGIPAFQEFGDWFNGEGVPAIHDFFTEARPLAESVLPLLGTGLGVTADAAKALAPAVKSIVDSFNDLPEAAQTAIVLGAGATMIGRKTTGGLGARAAGAAGATALGAAGAGAAGAGLTAPGATLVGGALALYGAYEVADGVKDNVARRPAPGLLGHGTGGTDQRTQATKDLQAEQAAKKNIEYQKQTAAMLAENTKKRKAATQAIIDGYDLEKAKAGEVNTVTIEQARRVAAVTEGVPRKVITQFTQPGYEGAVQNAIGLAKRYDLTPKQVRTTLEALDYSSADIKRVLRLMKQADDTHARPTVDAETAAAEADVRRLQGLINGMNGKTVHVAVKGGGGGITREADGGVLSFFADGGTEDHVAQIAPAGAWRVWAEDETGGEAYIPLAPSKRKRSQAIAMETVKQLGGLAMFDDVEAFAKGGIKKKKKAKATEAVAQIKKPDPLAQVPDAITVEDLANADMDPSISVYDAIGQRSFSDWAGEIAAASAAARERTVAQIEAREALKEQKKKHPTTDSITVGLPSATPKVTRSRASLRSAEKRSRNQQLEGATVQVVDSNGRSMRGVIRTRG